MERSKVLVFGQQGQLAQSLAERGQSLRALELAFAARPELDLEDESSIIRSIEGHRPHFIINAAAYTAVDRAETEARQAHQINGTAPAVMARAARQAGARLIHLSTDYVFDGEHPDAYRETDPVAPLNTYGRSKLAGEDGVREAHPEGHVIVRTSWVYSPFGNNFVKTMLNLARTRPSLNVVDDQIGTPTSALDLADGLFALIGRWRDDPSEGLAGTYHFAGRGRTSWAGLARHVLEVSQSRGGPFAEVVPITTAEYPTPAARPRYSILDSTKFQSAFGYAPPAWQDSAAAVVARLLDAER